MEIHGTYSHYILAAGGTTTISADSQISKVIVTSATVTLLAGVSITTSGTLSDGMAMDVACRLTALTLNGNTLTILGTTIDQDIITNAEFMVRGVYSSSKSGWIVTVIPDFSASSFIDTDRIKDDAVTKPKIGDDAVGMDQLEAFTGRGYLLRGGAAGAPELFDAKTSGQLVMGNGTDVLSVAMSGDVTISSTGVTTIGANKITEAMLNFTLTSYLEVTRILTSAEILALRTTAITLLSAPGANKYYELISVSAYNNYNSTTYNAGTDVLNLEVNGVALWTLPNTFIEATSSTATYGTKVADALIATNTAVNLRMSSADPTTGNGTIKVSAIYRIITGE